jgi:hypothetical protein
MDKKEIELEARIHALEIFAANQLSISCLTSGLDPAKMLETIKKQLSEGAKKLTFPGHDPATSDLLAAELEDALALLATMASEQINHVLKYSRK